MADLSRSVVLNVLGNRKSAEKAVTDTVKDAALISKLNPTVKIGGDSAEAKRAFAVATGLGEAYSHKKFDAKAGLDITGLKAALARMTGQELTIKARIDPSTLTVFNTVVKHDINALNAELAKIGQNVSLGDIRSKLENLAREAKRIFAKSGVADFLDINVEPAQIQQQIQLLKRKVQQATGIADFLDVNLNPAQIEVQLQLLKRKMQAANITDFLALSLDDAKVLQKLDRITRLKPTIDIHTSVSGATIPKLPGGENIKVGITSVGNLTGITQQLLGLAQAAKTAGDANKYVYAAAISARLAILGEGIAAGTAKGPTSDLGVAASNTARQMIGLAASSDKATEAAKFAYAAQLASAIAMKDAGNAAGGAKPPVDNLGNAAFNAGGRWGFLNRQIPLFAGALGTIPIIGTIGLLHLLVAVVGDILAVAIPATLALAAFGAAAVPTVQTLVKQFQNLFTVSTAFNQNIPPMTGGFAAAAAAVQPHVYVLFGAALDIINSKTGQFQKLAVGAGTVLDQLASRAQLALGSAGMSKFLDKANQDLSQLGNLIGNVFGILGNALNALPGVANVVLGVFVKLTSILEAISANRIVQGLFTVGTGIHGIAIYAGLAVTALAFLAPLLAGSLNWARGIASTATATGNLAANASRLDKTKAAFKDIGMAASGSQISVVKLADGTAKFGTEAGKGINVVSRFGTALVGLITNPWTWAIAGAVLVGILAFKMLTARDATTQWADSLQNLISRQVTFAGTISAMQSVIGQVGVALKGASSSVKILQNSSTQFGATQVQVNNALNAARLKVQDLTPEQQKYNAQLVTGRDRLSQMTLMFGSQAKAQQIANAVHINASKLLTESNADYKNNITTMQDYILAVQAVASAMGHSGTERYNAALNALNNTFITATLPDIQKVTQAQDALMNLIIGGRQGFLAFEQAITGVSAKLGTPPGLVGAASVAGASLSGLNAQSINLSNNFYNDAIPAAQKMIGALEQQNIGTRDLTTVVATQVKQMLPFTKGNIEARSVLVALINDALGPGTVSLKSLNTWVGNNSTSLQGLNAIIAKSTIVAGQLAGVLQNQVITQFGIARLATSGATTAISNLAAAMTASHPSALLIQSDAQILYNKLLSTHTMSDAAARSLVSGLDPAFRLAGNSSLTASGKLANFNTNANWILQHAPGAASDINNFASAIQNHGTKSDQYRSARARLIGDLMASGVSATNAKTYVNNLQTAINSMHGKAVGVKVEGAGAFTVSQVKGFSTWKPFFNLAGGGRVGGSGTGDTVPAMLTPGEAVVPVGLVPAVAPILKAGGVPGFAAGGLVPATIAGYLSGTINPAENAVRQALTAAVNSAVLAAANKAMAALKAAAVPGGIGGVGGPGGGAPSANAALAFNLYKSVMGPTDWAAWNFVEMHEAGWNQFARNPSSGAYGIPQALPESKLPFAGQAAGGSNPRAQITWMWNYMLQRYGGPQGAASHEATFNWYKGGGLIPEAVMGIGMNSGQGYGFHSGEMVTPASGAQGFASGGVAGHPMIHAWTLAQKKRAWGANRAPWELGSIFEHGRWWSGVPKPPGMIYPGTPMIHTSIGGGGGGGVSPGHPMIPAVSVVSPGHPMIPASRVRNAGGGGGGGDVIHITVAGDTDPDGAALRIHQKLRDYKRHKGGQKLGLD